MNKGLLEMRRRLTISDVVVEVHDARIPFTGRNSNFEYFHDSHILVLNKADLVGKNKDRKRIIEQLSDNGRIEVLYMNCKNAESSIHDKQNLMKLIIAKVAKIKKNPDEGYRYR